MANCDNFIDSSMKIFCGDEFNLKKISIWIDGYYNGEGEVAVLLTE